jgi:hypothetical protein
LYKPAKADFDDANYPGDALMARGKSVRLLASIPERYSPDFMERLDKRTVLGRSVLDRYGAVMSDLGGEEALSSVKRSLVRRFTWFEVMLEGMECRAAAGEDIDIGSWTQLTNTWLGIARLLGLERRSKPVESLHSLMYRDDPEPVAAPDEATAADRPADDATASPEEIAAQAPYTEAAP